jgi:hypothetical protein
MDGLEFLKNLATLGAAQGIPVVMITSERSEAHVEPLRNLADGPVAGDNRQNPITQDRVCEPNSGTWHGRIGFTRVALPRG